MSFIDKQELNNFNSFCKARGIENSLVNYIVWKGRFKYGYSNRKDKR